MGIFSDYRNYKTFEKDYDAWKNDRNILQAKKAAYLKNNPVSEAEKQEASQRGKSVLRSIDVMDEYSQARSEDTEVLAEQVSGQVLSWAMTLGMMAGTAILYLLPKKAKPVKLDETQQSNLQKILRPEVIIPFATGMLASIAASIPVLSWIAKAQVGASRHGRFEAITKDLKDPNKFVVLDENQQKELDETAKNIPVDKEMKKQLKRREMDLNPLGPWGSIKKLLFSNEEFEAQRDAFEDKFEQNKTKIGTKISEKTEVDAKKDQQLLLQVVEKVDIASQDYAENAELATNSVNFLSVFGSLGLGWLSQKITKKFPPKSQFAGAVIPWAVGLGTSLIVSSYSTSLQKQASRIGRYKVKKEMEQDPNNFIYVDEEKLKSQPEVPVEQKKNPNIIAFFFQLMKDNKEYKQYLKSGAIEEKKQQKAIDKMTFSDEQINRAKMLQFNTFNTFNKVDDNSQKYSESIEAVGQMIQMPIATIGELAGMAAGMLLMSKKMKKNPQLFSNSKIQTPEEKMNSLNAALPIIIGTLLGAIPAIAVDFYTTKEQKKASRIADMLAIKELSDHREFVDYDLAK